MPRIKALCPYCKGNHYTKKAFNSCKRRHGGYKWTKAGQKVSK